LAAEKPELVAKAESLIQSARTDDPNFPFQERPRPAKPKVAKPKANR
jgi:hypothetical protein